MMILKLDYVFVPFVYFILFYFIFVRGSVRIILLYILLDQVFRLTPLHLN